ncbi:MAG: D-threo-aldose 1-dehydrogenase [Microbacteriaceae bacterium]|nr:D-threo-aldose 1-dehydrogenase [Microbacteriaceae bacterium]
MTMTDAGWMRALGSTGIRVSAIAAGGSSFDGRAERPVDSDPIEPIRAVLHSPVRTIDTSAAYGAGESERRIGAAISDVGGLPADMIVTTKVAGQAGAFSGAHVRASIQASKERLGLSELPLVYLHDPEFHRFEDLTAPGGALETLVAMRESGEIGHLGVAGGFLPELNRYLDTGVFEVVLVHNRWTLVDRSADALIDRAVGEGVAVVNAAIYGGGILAAPTAGLTTYGYRPAKPAILESVAAMSGACDRFGVDLASAALQFSLRDERVSMTVIGLSSASRLEKALSAAREPLPDDLWRELDDQLAGPESWLDAD